MGRMFRIISEGSHEFPNGGPAVALTEAEPFIGGGAPFVEVGGPNGAVHSLPKPAPKLVATIDAPRPVQPRQADDRYLSVALHQIAPKPNGSLPNGVASEVVAHHHPDHPVSAEYRALATDLRGQAGDDGAKAILLTAAETDCGTTTVLLNLAVTLAAEPGVRVVIVDAEFDRPAAARKLGLADMPGLAEVLAQEMPLAWAIQPTAVPRMQVLGAGNPTVATAASFAADFPKLVVQLRQWFDWVLVDGGVWGERPYRDATGPAFDGVYLITRQNESERPEIAALRAEVAKLGGLLRGYITTRCNSAAA
jgi:Mrp family chromosome partitioning ATPase